MVLTPAVPAACPAPRRHVLTTRALSLIASVSLGLAAAPALSPRAEAAGPAAAPPATRAPSISVTTAEVRTLTETTLVSGTLVAREEVSVSNEVEGLAITELLVEEGDTVVAGQVLARLSRAQLETQRAQNEAARARALAAIAQAEAQIAEADATLAEAESNLARIRALRATGTSSVQELDSRVTAARASEARANAARQGLQLARAELASVEANRAEIEVRWTRTEIKAPAGGFIARRAARLGAIASTQAAPLFVIVADGDIELEADVPEVALARMAPGQPARVTPAGLETPIDGKIRLIMPEIDRTSRLGKVRISIPRTPGTRIGAFAQGQLVLASGSGVSVPLSSVVFTGTEAYVQRVENDIVSNQRVKIGLRANGFIEIVEGLKAGDTVLLRAGGFVRPGDRITPTAPAAGKSVSG